MNFLVSYTKETKKFLKKNPSQLTKTELSILVELAARKIILNERNNCDVTKLVGIFQGIYRIRKGKIRILCSLEENNDGASVVIHNINFRGNIYK